MREIKFKAWNKEKKIMSHPYTLNQLRIDAWLHRSINALLPPDALIWLQYIGLKVGKKEIYREDIIQIRYKDGDVGIGVVKFGKTAYYLGYKIFRNGKEIRHYHDFTWSSFLDKDNVKIIGNTYENPELVESE